MWWPKTHTIHKVNSTKGCFLIMFWGHLPFDFYHSSYNTTKDLRILTQGWGAVEQVGFTGTHECSLSYRSDMYNWHWRKRCWAYFCNTYKDIPYAALTSVGSVHAEIVECLLIVCGNPTQLQQRKTTEIFALPVK